METRPRRAALSLEDEVMLAQTIERGRAAQERLDRTPRPRGRTRTQLSRDAHAGEEARTELITKNVPLVAWIAKGYRRSGLDFADLVSEGTVGLIKAADTFDWRYGAPFSTWARRWIKQSIERQCMAYTSLVRMPVGALYDRHAVVEVRDRFLSEHGREPTITELAGIAELSEERVQELLDAPMTQTPLAGSDDNSDSERQLFVDDTQVDEQAVDTVTVEQVADIFSPFTPQEVQVLMLRVGATTGEAMSVKAVADYLGMQPRAVHVIEQNFVTKARHPQFALFPGGHP